MVALSTPRTRSPVERAGSKSSRARACQRKACEMLCLRAELRHKAEAEVVRTDEIKRTPGESASDLPVRRRGRSAGDAVVSETGVRTLARLVSSRDATLRNEANGLMTGELAEKDINGRNIY